MSTDKIDKAIYDKDRYESLRQRGVSEDRAKRVATVPLERDAKEKTASERKAAYRPEDAQASAQRSRPATVRNVTDPLQ